MANFIINFYRGQKATEEIMWKIIQIFDGDYGCEELVPGEKPRVSVTLENERGEQKYIFVEDEWLVENNLDIGSKWPEEM